jgi:hypothetical protein
MHVISRRRTALFWAKTRRRLTRGKLNGQKGLSEVTHHRQIPLQGHKIFTVIIILWVIFKVGRLYFPFVKIPQIVLDLGKAEILLWS